MPRTKSKVDKDGQGVFFHLVIPTEMARALKVAAEDQDRSMSSLVRVYIRQGLELDGWSHDSGT